MLNLLLAESEMELVPREIASHPSVKANAKRRGKPPGQILLDSTIHHSALRRLPGGERRGRPDLVHFYLLLALDSILNKRGLLRTYIHTRNGEFISVNPTTRIPKNYNRFVGLMESLFIHGSVPPQGEALLEIRPGYDLKKCLEEIPHTRVIALNEGGRRVDLEGHFKGIDGDCLCVIGGFSKGDFQNDTSSFADETLSISEESLTVWTVTSEVLVSYGHAIMD